MTKSTSSGAKKRNRWFLAGAAVVALFGPVVYAVGPKGTGVPHEYGTVAVSKGGK